MGVAAFLAMWPKPRKQTFVPPRNAGSICNLASIGPVALEKKFENVDKDVDASLPIL